MEQTKGLLEHGHISSRGKAYAEGNAHLTIYPQGSSKNQWKGTGYSSWDDLTYDAAEALEKAAEDLSKAADSTSGSSDEFRETFDWVEVRIEEINDNLSLKAAQLENAVGPKAQNAIIADMIEGNQILYDNLLAGANKYYSYAKTLLKKVPKEYREMAKNGAIAIEEFFDKEGSDVSEEALNAIQEYREWVQKGDDLTEQAEATLTEIAKLAKQAFDNIAKKYDNKNDKTEAKNEKLEAAISLTEEKGEPVSKKYYQRMITNTETIRDSKKEEREALQADLDAKVENGDIKKYSDDWYDMVAQIYEVDIAIINCEKDIESYKNAMSQIYWDNFEEGISRIEYLEDETQNLIDLMGNIDNPVDEDGNWTEEGITSMGLYAQQMEIAEYKSKQYKKAISDLNAGYKKGKYSESEYLEKLNELKKGQQDSIKSYYDAQDAIKDLQKTRVDAIKNGIDKEIDAYDELIQKKKEELSAEKDLYDFQKSTKQSAKNIADIQRKLAALAGDNSASAIAKRKQLEAELAEAKEEQEDLYYNRSIENQQNALDKENEAFQEEKEKEKEGWDKWLEDTDGVLAKSLELVLENAGLIGTTLEDTAKDYGLKISDSILKPWEDGLTAVDNYDIKFGNSASETTTKLGEMKTAWQNLIAEMDTAASIEINRQKAENKATTQAKKKKDEDPKTEEQKTLGGAIPPPEEQKTPDVGSTVTVEKTATHFSSKSKNAKMASFVPGGSYIVYEISGDEVLIGRDGVYTGWVKKSDLVGYAKGTKGVKKDQLALIDELGEELVMHADGNGKLAFLSKGSAVIPHDITENLMKLGSLDPQVMLDQNRPQIAPNQNIVNTEISIDCSVGTLMNIEHCDQNTLPDVEKMVNKAFEKQVQKMNNSLKRFVR